VHVKEQPQTFKRFGVQWTPTLLFMDSGGVERHRVEGYLPVEDFLGQLKMGHAKIAFGQGRFADAQMAFRAVHQDHPRSVSAPEARYWEGVSAYKATNDASHLGRTGADLQARWPDSEWARKASVWLPQQETIEGGS
jgi:hypothetical protein